MKSDVNGMTRKTSTPISSTSSARRVSVVSWAGWLPGEHDLHRMRVEGHQHGRHTAGATGLDRVVDQFLVSAVHTVEHPDRDDTSPPPVGRDLVLSPPPALHEGKPTARRGGPRVLLDAQMR